MPCRKCSWRLLASFWLLGVASCPAAGSEVVYASLGIGDDDPIAIEMMRRLHNLQLTFALKGSGSYLADIRLSIHHAAGEKVLAATSPGPLFFATLPAGQYRIDAEYRGKTLSRTTKVTQGGRRDVYFYWDEE